MLFINGAGRRLDLLIELECCLLMVLGGGWIVD
jgi:hypothetical protein